MTYQQTIEFLFSCLPMYSKIGSSAYKKDLTNIIALCNFLGNPQNNFKSIHIAGTNGKGSTSHMLSAIMQKAGYKTGLYTSPHLKDFRERIKIDGIMCDKDFIVEFVKKIKTQIDIIQPSFFEVTVAMAFEYFAHQKVDIAIIETGLGGRLDSTNIIHPILSVITNIGYDHMDILGDTLELIASEKAGIIKHNVPVVIGEYLPKTKPVFINKAQLENSTLHYASDNYSSEIISSKNHRLEVRIKSSNSETDYNLDLVGSYQIKNLITALEACNQLNKMNWNITIPIIQDAVSNAKTLTGLMGRWQIIQENPNIVLDVGHNVDGIKEIVLQLNQSKYKSLHIILGMVKEKDHNAVLQLLPKQATYYFTNSQIERALPKNELMFLAKNHSLNGNTFENVNTAISKAKENTSKEDLILVCGSVFLVAEVDY